MQIIIKSRQLHVTTHLRQRIESKLQRLERFVAEDARVEVTVAEEQTRSASDHYSIQLALAGHAVRSEVSAQSATAALDLAIDKIIAQLGRQKDRQTTARRHHTTPMKVLGLSRTGVLSSMEDELAEEAIAQVQVEDGPNEAIWSRVLEIRRLPATPMTDQEVIAHMEQDGVAFYPFFNEETSSVNVMYKLEQGGYGLLVPAIE